MTPLVPPPAPSRQRRTTESLDLEWLLRAHALQASDLANLVAIAEGQMLEFSTDDSCENPDAAIKIAERLESIRRSATDDIRRTASVLGELHQKPTPVQIAVVSQTANPLDSAQGTGRLLDEGIKDCR